MNQLYPLKFTPIFNEKIWGGNRIKEVFGLNYNMDNCGEAWLISGLKEKASVVSNGFLAGNELPELLEIYMDDLLGGDNYEKYADNFPLLIKFIDSNDYLSVQVHPDDDMAEKLHKSFGKNEMWYLNKVEPGADIICGFNRNTNKDEFIELLNKNRVKEVLNFMQVASGDVIYVPAGRIHSLGPGILLTEIQQSSDITYRVYDWDRKDKDGKLRELHTEFAVKALDYKFYKNYKTSYPDISDIAVTLCSNDFFTTNLLKLNKPINRDFGLIDSFVIYICQKGKCTLNYNTEKIELNQGEALLIPALITEFSIFPDKYSELLEVYID